MQAELGDDLRLELFARGQEALALKSGDRRAAMPAVARGWGWRRPTPPRSGPSDWVLRMQPPDHRMSRTYDRGGGFSVWRA